MRRRTLLVPLLAVALVGLATGQSATEKKVEIVKYPGIPSAEDAAGEVQSEAARKVLDDFYQSKILVEEHEAAVTNDPAIWDRVLADRLVDNNERFGTGFKYRKEQFLANFRTGGHKHTTLQHDHVRLVPFGDDIVVVTAHSTSVLHFGGRLSKGPRLATDVFVKLDGRWQEAVHAIGDLEDGMEERAKP